MAPLVLVVLSGTLIWWDLPVARFFAADPMPGTIRDIIDLSEVFGHGAGVVYFLVAVFLLDEGRRRCIPRMAACSLGAGLAADVIKMIVSRTRPRAADLWASNPLDTFGDFFPFSASDAHLHSFPSAHTGVAFGLAFAMSTYYPKGRVLFFLLAALCGIHRMQANAHFLSDVLMGAALGMLVAQFCFRFPPVSRFFGKLERKRTSEASH